MQLAAQLAQFLPRHVQRVMQQFELFLDLVLGQRPGVDAVAAGLHQSGTPERHAMGGDGAIEQVPHGWLLAEPGMVGPGIGNRE